MENIEGQYRQRLVEAFGGTFEPEEFAFTYHPPAKGEHNPRWVGDFKWEHAIGPHCYAMSHLEADYRAWEYPVAFGWGATTPVYIAAKFLLAIGVLPGLWIDPALRRASEQADTRVSFREQPQVFARCREQPEAFRLAVGWPLHYYDPVGLRCLCWVRR